MDEKELVLNELINFSIPEIPSQTRFWMVRTKQGYFYHEFITKEFIALAWNLIDQDDSFEEDSEDKLKDLILVKYPEIKRPKTVINKCNLFINELSENDFVVIPSAGSEYVTVARVGKYYEDDSKTYDLEKATIPRIEQREFDINEVPCPYKKRRKIKPLMTVHGSDINSHLYKAISNYHGLSCLDDYANLVLDVVYPIYIFRGCAALVFNVRTNASISPKSLSGLLSSVSTFLEASNFPENNISTQIEVSSPGQIVFIIKDALSYLGDNAVALVVLLLVITGGSFKSLQLPGIHKVLVDILTIGPSIKDKLDEFKYKRKMRQEECTQIELAIAEKFDRLSPEAKKFFLENHEHMEYSGKALQITPPGELDLTPRIPVEVSPQNEPDDE